MAMTVSGRLAAVQRVSAMRAAGDRLPPVRDDVVAFARAAGFAPDDWQADVLMSAAPRTLLNCARQAGKSTTVAILASHVLTFRPRALVLVVSPTERQSAETVRRVRDVLGALDWPVPAVADGVAHLELANAARLVALPGRDDSSVRGYSGPSLVLFDEASRVSDALFYAVSPMLAVSGGRALALSTPFGSRGWWYQACRAAQEAGAAGQPPMWRYVEVPAARCPRISAEYLAAERTAMGAWWFEQEYGCQFLDNQTAAFTQADIDRAFAEDYETWDLRPWTAADHARERAAVQNAHPGPRPRLQWEVAAGLPAGDDEPTEAEQAAAWASFRARTASR